MITVAVTGVDATEKHLIVDGTLALSGNYGGGATHGDTLSFAGFDAIKSSSVPARVEIFEAPPAGTSATGYVYNFSPGTTQANGVMQVFTGGAAQSGLTELTQGSAYSAGAQAAALKFRAFFPSFV
jgi:hypothetical protein